MTLDQLRHFEMAGKYESFTVAAERLYSHTSTISRSVGALEEELGILLFNRTNRGIHLTEAGQYFMGEIALILDALAVAVGQARNYGKHTSEKFVVRLGENMYTCVSGLFTAFLSEFPTAYLDIDTYFYKDSMDVCRQLDDRSIDLYFGYRDNIPTSGASAWNLRRVYNDTIAVMVGKNHRLAEKESISLKDLEGETLLSSDFHDHHLEHLLLAKMREAGYARPIPVHGLRYRDLFMRVSAGLGVSFVAAKTTSATSWDCRTIPFEDLQYEKPLYMIWHRDNKNPTLGKFLEVCSRVLAGQVQGRGE